MPQFIIQIIYTYQEDVALFAHNWNNVTLLLSFWTTLISIIVKVGKFCLVSLRFHYQTKHLLAKKFVEIDIIIEGNEVNQRFQAAKRKVGKITLETVRTNAKNPKHKKVYTGDSFHTEIFCKTKYMGAGAGVAGAPSIQYHIEYKVITFSERNIDAFRGDLTKVNNVKGFKKVCILKYISDFVLILYLIVK